MSLGDLGWSLYLTLSDNRAFIIRIALVRNNVRTACCPDIARRVNYIMRLEYDDIVSTLATI